MQVLAKIFRLIKVFVLNWLVKLSHKMRVVFFLFAFIKIGHLVELLDFLAFNVLKLLLRFGVLMRVEGIFLSGDIKSLLVLLVLFGVVLVAVFGDNVLTIVETDQIAIKVSLLKGCDQVGVGGLLPLRAIILRLQRNDGLALEGRNLRLLVYYGLLIQLYYALRHTVLLQVPL